MRIHSIARVLLAIVLLWNTTAAIACAAETLHSEVRDLTRSAALGKANIAVSVRDCRNGREIVSLNATRSMIPASNMKLFSTGAALLELGHDFRFKTELRQSGNDLVLIGDGDPSIANPKTFKDLMMRTADGVVRDFDEEAILGLWVQSVRRAGITNITRLRIDDRIFERTFVHPSWKTDQLNRPYSAEVAGLNFHVNCIDFLPAPGTNRPNWNTHRPRSPWILEQATNKSTNARKSDSHTPWIAGKAGSNIFQFRGAVKTRSIAPVSVTVEDPPIFMGRLISNRLNEAGVTISLVQRVNDEEEYPKGTLIEPIISTPLMPVVEHCNEESQNLYAEALLKRTVSSRTGRPGSWADADHVMKSIIREQFGPDAESMLGGVFFDDGSGLSRKNRINAALTTAWLTRLQSDSEFGEGFVDSLAEGGREGTLKKRFPEHMPNGAVVDAKSGYINGVSCLSGYVSFPGGKRYAFSVLVNNATNIGNAKRLQEQVANAIARRLGP